jgi:hypothetical protein
MKRETVFFLLFILILLYSAGCREQYSEKIHLPSKQYRAADIDFTSLKKTQTVYVPAYSDIYHGTGKSRFLLTITLSIRNTSLREVLYIGSVEYHDSEGKLIKKYLKSPVRMNPLESIEFVVEDQEQQGGAGANFLVTWGANATDTKPIIQAVMIGTISQQGISFVTESVVVEEKIAK